MQPARVPSPPSRPGRPAGLVVLALASLMAACAPAGNGSGSGPAATTAATPARPAAVAAPSPADLPPATWAAPAAASVRIELERLEGESGPVEGVDLVIEIDRPAAEPVSLAWVLEPEPGAGRRPALPPVDGAYWHEGVVTLPPGQRVARVALDLPQWRLARAQDLVARIRRPQGPAYLHHSYARLPRLATPSATDTAVAGGTAASPAQELTDRQNLAAYLDGLRRIEALRQEPGQALPGGTDAARPAARERP